MNVTAMSHPPSFRRRTMGRAASPPTWACYEQIPYDDDEDSDSASDDMSCSEDGEDYGAAAAAAPGAGSEDTSDSEVDQALTKPKCAADEDIGDAQNMDIDGDGDGHAVAALEAKRDVKGKQRAIEPEPEITKRRQRKKEPRRPMYTLRPILTIQRSQGFVWNQDLFVPPYIKDRYVASTSPSNCAGFMPSSVSSTNSTLTDYEVEVVEIRVNEGDLDGIIP